MTHNEYWENVHEKSAERLRSLFRNSNKCLDEIIGDDNGIDSYHDAKRVLAYVLDHCPSADEKACAILSVVESLAACHEIHEQNSSIVK
ncbi:MAG: hypothetical protein ACI4QT_04955 [Kiritimatiellia bacterium]